MAVRVSTSEPDDLVGIYRQMPIERDRGGSESGGCLLSGIGDHGIKRIDVGGAAVRVPPRRRERSLSALDPPCCNCLPSST
jgi:hypothetical protein